MELFFLFCRVRNGGSIYLNFLLTCDEQQALARWAFKVTLIYWVNIIDSINCFMGRLTQGLVAIGIWL